jgi:hypothetical protein
VHSRRRRQAPGTHAPGTQAPGTHAPGTQATGTRAACAWALALLLLGCTEVGAQPPSSPAAAPTQEEVRAAVAKLRDDPNLGGEHTLRSLRWVSSRASPPPPESPAWVVGLFQFLGETASVLIWIAGGVAVAVAAVWLYRLLKTRSTKARITQSAMTSHVGELDIRPTSLPDDIGAAALALLQAGRSRDALSLLYRGALSRAVHRFGVAIDESFTEGEALRAVDARLDRPRAEYFGELVGLWQRAVYAGQTAASDPVAALCTRFASALDGAVP